MHAVTDLKLCESSPTRITFFHLLSIVSIYPEKLLDYERGFDRKATLILKPKRYTISVLS